MDCILERREEHTTLANTHVEDLCVGGVAALLNDIAKLTLSDADLTVLTAFVRKRLVANVCRIMIYRHMHCIDTGPSLSRTRTLTSHDSPESSRRLVRVRVCEREGGTYQCNACVRKSLFDKRSPQAFS